MKAKTYLQAVAALKPTRAEIRRRLIAGTHKIEVDRHKGTAKLVPTGTKHPNGGHSEKDLEAVCREIYGDHWTTVPYWYIPIVREQAIRVLDWVSIKEYL